MYLRIDSGLGIPIMAFQRPNRCVPVELCEAYELRDSRLLLRAVYCWHLVLALGLALHQDNLLPRSGTIAR